MLQRQLMRHTGEEDEQVRGPILELVVLIAERQLRIGQMVNRQKCAAASAPYQRASTA